MPLSSIVSGTLQFFFDWGFLEGAASPVHTSEDTWGLGSAVSSLSGARGGTLATRKWHFVIARLYVIGVYSHKKWIGLMTEVSIGMVSSYHILDWCGGCCTTAISILIIITRMNVNKVWKMLYFMLSCTVYKWQNGCSSCSSVVRMHVQMLILCVWMRTLKCPHGHYTVFILGLEHGICEKLY